MQDPTQFKKIAIVVMAVILVLIGGYLFISKSLDTTSVSYTGLSASGKSLASNNQAGITEFDENLVTVDAPYTPRTIGGGGDTWVISLLETQPKIFTGKFIANSGVETYTVLLDERDGVLSGDAKSVKNTNVKKALKIKKTDSTCFDTEGNSYPYALSGIFDGKAISGCGGVATENPATAGK